MYNSEKIVITFFKSAVAVGTGSILYGIGQNASGAELTPMITATFLLSIYGNCTRALARYESGPSEKIAISAAAATYSAALFGDLYLSLILAICLKLFTTCGVGLWNARQMMRLNPRASLICWSNQNELHASFNNQNPSINAINDDVIGDLAALSCYCSGVALGLGPLFLIDSSLEKREPFVSFAFIMTHCGNLIRTTRNPDASMSEHLSIRAAVICYLMALCCDFYIGYIAQIDTLEKAAAYGKLVAAILVGLWNTLQTKRLNSNIHPNILYEEAIQNPMQSLAIAEQDDTMNLTL